MTRRLLAARIAGALAWVAVIGAAAPADAQPHIWAPIRSYASPQTAGTLVLVNAGTGDTIARHDYPSSNRLGEGRLTRDGTRYLSVSAAGVEAFDARTGARLGQAAGFSGGEVLELSPDERFAYVCTFSELAPNRGCRLHRWPDGLLLDVIPNVWRVAFSTSGDRHYIFRRAVPSVLEARSGTDPGTILWQRTISTINVDVTNLLADDAGVVLSRASGPTMLIEAVSAATGELVMSRSTALTFPRMTLGAGRIFITWEQTFEAWNRTTLATEHSVTWPALQPGDAFSYPAFAWTIHILPSGARGYIVIQGQFYPARILGFTPATLEWLPGFTEIDNGIVGRIAATDDTSCSIRAASATPLRVTPGTTLRFDVEVEGTCPPWGIRTADTASGPFRYLGLVGATRRAGSSTVFVATSTLVASTGSRHVTLGPHRFVVFIEPDPRVPPMVRAAASVGGGAVVLRWDVPPGPLPTLFQIEGGLEGAGTQARVPLPVSARTFAAPVGPGNYFARIISANRAGVGGVAEFRFSIGATTAPQAPTGLAADVRGSYVQLSWQAPAPGPRPTHYVIEAGAGGVFVPVAQTGELTPSYTVGRVPAGTYGVRVRAANEAGVSPPSDVVTIVPTSCAGAPGAPAGLQFTYVGGVLTLMWSVPPSGADEFVIEAGSDLGRTDLARLATGSPVSTFSTTAPPGVYVLRLRTRNACGESSASNEVMALIP